MLSANGGILTALAMIDNLLNITFKALFQQIQITINHMMQAVEKYSKVD